MVWNLYARNPDGTKAGEIDHYNEAELTPVFNDVGTWRLKLPATASILQDLAQPGAGMIACRDDVPLVSGPQRGWRRVKNATEDYVEFTGYTDEVWLKNRTVSPSPTESYAPYTVQATDNRTGLASTVISQYVDVNAGPSAVASREVPGLTIGADPGAGSSVTGTARWELSLLAFIQPLAISGGIGFRVVQVGNSLQFQPYAVVDRSASVKFSHALGNLASLDYSVTAPDGNYFFVGGTGTGISRVIKEYSDNDSVAAWGRIEGEFVNRQDTADATQLQQSGTDALKNGTERLSLAITPLETPYQKFGVHYFLGDQVTVKLEDTLPTVYGESGLIVDVLRSVTIKLTPDEVSVTPVIGTPGRSDLLRMFRTLKSAVKRLNQLERQ